MIIQIGFSSTKNPYLPFAWAIRKVLKTSYSHTYLKYYSEEMQQPMVFQASGLAVNLMSYDQFLTIENVYKEFEISVTDDQWKLLRQEFCRGLGQPYSSLQILNSLLYIAFKWHPFKNIEGWDCSKLMETILASLGYNMPESPDVVTPKDVYEYLSDKIS